jgi:hypothetical protein
MNVKSIAAGILIAAGIVVLAYEGITYTSREKVVDLGPLQVTAEKANSITLPPIIGVVALAGGIVLLGVGNKKT